MEHFGDLLLQLMKHGTNTLHVAFIFLFSIIGSLHFDQFSMDFFIDMDLTVVKTPSSQCLQVHT